MILRLYLWINDQRGDYSSIFHDEGEEMNGSVACTTEHIDSYTQFSLPPNIPGSVCVPYKQIRGVRSLC